MPLTDNIVLQARDLLLRQLGKPYQFGFEVNLADADPYAFDCSELVQWLFAKLGFNDMPDGSWNQYEYCNPIVHKQPLDLGFYKSDRIYHVGVIYDEHWMVHAKNTSSGVVKEPVIAFEASKHFCGWRRPKCLSA